MREQLLEEVWAHGYVVCDAEGQGDSPFLHWKDWKSGGALTATRSPLRESLCVVTEVAALIPVALRCVSVVECQYIAIAITVCQP